MFFCSKKIKFSIKLRLERKSIVSQVLSDTNYCRSVGRRCLMVMALALDCGSKGPGFKSYYVYSFSWSIFEKKEEEAEKQNALANLSHNI